MITHSTRVRAKDFREPWLIGLASELHQPLVLHRKLWEYCAVAQVWRQSFGTLKGLGFGVSEEPLATWFAVHHGTQVVMTDNQNPMRISSDLQGQFDFTWSISKLQHLGSLQAGLGFFCQQMRCLKPGGIAIHTTEFNPLNGQTLDSPGLSLFRWAEIGELTLRLAKQGDHLWQPDLDPGTDPEDNHVDTEPWGLPHLTIQVGSFVTTSMVLIAQRGTL